MKKIYLVVFSWFIFVLSTAFGQNGLKSGAYFLLRDAQNKVSLNQYRDYKIIPEKSYKITGKTLYTTDQKTRVALLDTAKNTVTLHWIHSIKKRRLVIPFDIKPKCLLLNDENLFIGGELGKEMLIQYHIPSKKWFRLKIPTKVLSSRKGIDDLVINDTTLIAIDNMVFPKYVLFYPLKSTDSLAFSAFVELKSDEPYEHIYRGRITNDYIILHSGSFSGYSGAYDHIKVYDLKDLNKNFSLSFSGNQVNDIAVAGNKLLIANKKKGLGIFEINATYLEPTYIYDECEDTYTPDRNNYFFGDKGEMEVKYQEYSGKILKMTVLVNTSKVILTLENEKGEIIQEIVETDF